MTPGEIVTTLFRQGIAEWSTWGNAALRDDDARVLAETFLGERDHLGHDRLVSSFNNAARVHVPPCKHRDPDAARVTFYRCRRFGKDGRPVGCGATITITSDAKTVTCPRCRRRHEVARLIRWDNAGALHAAVSADKARHKPEVPTATSRNQEAGSLMRRMENYGVEGFTADGMPGSEGKIEPHSSSDMTTLSAIAAPYRPVRHADVEAALIKHGMGAYAGITGSLKRHPLPRSFLFTERGKDFVAEMVKKKAGRRAINSTHGHFPRRYGMKRKR